MSERIFIGRENELASLQEAWQRAKSGHPQMVVLLAETGLGKTRVVQEFYGWLSETDVEDPQGYWPDTLQIGHNLELNPPADTVNLQVEIPWLWWGMRFHPVDERNQATIRRSPFEDEDPNLVVHGEPIKRRRKIRTARKEAAKTLGGIFTDILTGGVAGTVLSLNDLRKKRGDEKIESEALASDAAALVKKRSEEINETVLGLLTWFMDEKVTDAPTVPVILILDDAQWSDPATARSVDAILAKAAQRNWQLLIVATHWQREWEQEREQYDADEEGLGSFYQTYHRWAELNSENPEAASLLRLAKLDQESLLPVVEVRLPGILDEHKQRLLIEADGNPRALEEMIELLVAKPEYFQDKNPHEALSRRGIQRLARLEKTSLFDKARQRFDEISTEIQDVVACGSMFGSSFLRPIVEEILQGCELDEDWSGEDGIDGKLQEAERIHAIIHKLSENNHEFQQRVYHEVASHYLAEDPELQDARRRVLDARIAEWLTSDKLSRFESREREIFYAFVIDYYLDDPEFHQEWAKEAARAFFDYLSLLGSRGAESEIVGAWKRVAKKIAELPDRFLGNAAYAAPSVLAVARNSREDQENARVVLEALDQAAMRLEANHLIRESWPDVKVQLASYFGEFTDQSQCARTYALQSHEMKQRELASSGETRERLMDLAGSVDQLGYLALKVDGDSSRARQYIEESLALSRRVVEQFGETALGLSHVSIALNRLGDLGNAVDEDRSWARQHFEESLALAHRVVEQFGVTPDRIRNVSIPLERLGDLMVEVYGDAEAARQRFEMSLSLSHGILEEFGETPERLRDHGLTLGRLGDVARHGDSDPKEARRYLHESLAVARRVLDQFGETADRLRDVIIVLYRLGELAIEIDGDPAAARRDFDEDLALARRILEQYGVTEERLQVCCDTLGWLSYLTNEVEGDHVTARRHVEESLALRRHIVEQYGETAARLQDVCVALDRLGDLAIVVDGDHARARRHFEESLHLARHILEQWGESPARLRAVCVALNRLGGLAVEVEGDYEQARRHFEEVLALGLRIVEQFHETPQSLQAVYVALDRLGDLAIRIDGDHARARRHFMESLAMRRRILEQNGETRDQLLDLSVALDRVGDLYHEVDDDNAAGRQYFEESLEICRKVVEQYSPSKAAVNNLSVALDKCFQTENDQERKLGLAEEAWHKLQRFLEFCPEAEPELGPPKMYWKQRVEEIRSEA